MDAPQFLVDFSETLYILDIYQGFQAYTILCV